MPVHETILELIGNTPLVRLRRVTRGIKATVLAKVETLNPGGSVKDRIAMQIVADAENAGLLQAGGTIVEATAGNTGVGLALVAAIKGYRCIFVMPDKMSEDKIRLLRAYGADVVITPSSVAHDSPDSYTSVAKRLAAETPGGFLANQFYNNSNPDAHYRTTGPEIWEQSDGKVDMFVAGAGTGGTLTGVGRYLKEHNPHCQIVLADPEGSTLSGDHARPYKVEGIGQDYIPGTLDMSVIDRFERVTDKDAFLMARRVTREEGIMMGGSSGTAVVAALRAARELEAGQTCVVLISDTGRNYMTKVFSDDWMKENGFLEATMPTRVADILGLKHGNLPPMVAVQADQPVHQAVQVMREHGISQLPVMKGSELIGSLIESALMNQVFSDISLTGKPVAHVMSEPFPMLDRQAPIEGLYQALSAGSQAVIVTDIDVPIAVLTKMDLINFLAGVR
ncbi:MAG: cystathionine beta-synthase [Candidatus Sericytochromatia bacterium]|nr:cystathionine beta-synthase [Candidatus Sericytochromatia bacterium]